MKRFLFITVLTVILFSSCDTSDNVTKKESQTNLSSVQLSEMKNVCSLIDSLNTVYTMDIVKPQSRGFGRSLFDVCSGNIVDEMGSVVGGFVGKWVGSAIGSATGNPVFTVAGYVGGRYVGRKAGSVAASTAFAMALSKCHLTVPNPNINKDEYVYYNPNAFKRLTLNDIDTTKNKANYTDGEIHNIIMVKLVKNYDKYINPDNTLNYNLLISDALKYEQEIVNDPNYDMYYPIVKDKLTEQTKRIINASLNLDLENDYDAYYDRVYNTLIPEIKISREEFNYATSISKNVSNTYFYLNTENTIKLSNEIDNVIDSSKLNDETKLELKNSNSILKSSSMLWKQLAE